MINGFTQTAGIRFTASIRPLILGLLLTQVSLADSPERTSPRPNIIFVMADDLGYGDLGCFGQKTLKTPRLDRLAQQGMRITSFYAGNTVCRPSRLVLWTGLHPGHAAINDNQKYVFQDDDVTVAELFQQHGYVTAGFGKWAMGSTTGHPNRHGFDYWFGYLDQSEAHNYYPTHLYENQKSYRLPGNELLDHPQARGRVSAKKVTHSHEVITGKVLEFIRQHADQPFLAHVHWTIPHTNNEAGRVQKNGMEVPDYGAFANEDWPDPEKGFARMIEMLDTDVGRIVDTLTELNIASRTLLIFTSDNGPHQEGGHQHEFFDSNGPLRGYKRDLHEGGIRVPTIAWWPGTIPEGTECDVPLAFWDYLPTACELAGIEVTSSIDGISFAQTLTEQADPPARDYLFFRFNKRVAVRAGNWKAVRDDPNKPWELYDLSQDLGEQQDLAERFPQRVKQLAGYAVEAEQKSSR